MRIYSPKTLRRAYMQQFEKMHLSELQARPYQWHHSRQSIMSTCSFPEFQYRGISGKGMTITLHPGTILAQGNISGCTFGNIPVHAL